MRPYGIELRTRIVEAHRNREGSVRELAERFAVAPNTVQNYLNLYRATGGIAPRPHGGGVSPKIDDQGLQQVRLLLEETPDATVDELADEFSRQYHIAVGRSTMDRALHRLGVTRKKKRFMRPSGTRQSASRRGKPSRSRSRRSHPSGWFSSMNSAPISA